MAKGWREIGTNSINPIMTRKEHKNYLRKMFKLGLMIDRMPISKPKFAKVKKTEVETEENE